MEALLQFLETSQIPVSGINLGPVYKKDVIRASIMNEVNKPEFAVILAFDVEVCVTDRAVRLAVLEQQ